MFELFVAFFVLSVLTGATIFVLSKLKVLTRPLVFFLLFFTILYLGTTLFIHYTEFYPFGGGEGDQVYYHEGAVLLAQDFREGNFSITNIEKRLEETYTDHWYPVLLGGLYSVTLPEKIVGKMLSVWFVVLSLLMVYAIALEIGAGKKAALLTAGIAGFYPSYLYFGSLLLRESLVAFLALAALYLIIRLVRAFSWQQAGLLLAVMFLLTHFRFYISIAAFVTFFVSWFVIAHMRLGKRVIYGVFLGVLFGLIPQIQGLGFFYADTIQYYKNPEVVVSFQGERDLERKLQDVSGALSSSGAPVPLPGEQAPSEVLRTETSAQDKAIDRDIDIGSTLIQILDFHNPVSFVKNYGISFVSVAGGPFPWQIRYVRQLPALAEAIPWLVLFLFILRGVFMERKRWRDLLPILLLSICIVAGVALFINNYGTFMRIRIPAFLALLTLLPLGMEIFKWKWLRKAT